MATNNGKGSRQGVIRERTQVFNPSTGNYVKRDTNTGRFLDVKSDGSPFKGVRKEKTSIKSNPNIQRSIAKKAESAVIKIKNGKK
jgi:hypothetical protein